MKCLPCLLVPIVLAGCDVKVAERTSSEAAPATRAAGAGAGQIRATIPDNDSNQTGPTKADIEKAGDLAKVYLLKEEKLKKLVEDFKKGPYSVSADQAKTRDERRQHNAEVIAKVAAILKMCDETKVALSQVEAMTGPRLDGLTTVEHLHKVRSI